MNYILVVDDERTFRRFPGETFYAKTSLDAIDFLKNNSVEELWLDHDLGGEDTTMKVVDFLVEHKEDFEGLRIFIHSMNPVGAMNIDRALRRYFSVYRTSLPECDSKEP